MKVTLSSANPVKETRKLHNTLRACSALRETKEDIDHQERRLGDAAMGL
jgi:hypothetical protein